MQRRDYYGMIEGLGVRGGASLPVCQAKNFQPHNTPKHRETCNMGCKESEVNSIIKTIPVSTVQTG